MKVVVIGGGVAGIRTALALGRLGLSPILIEKEATLEEYYRAVCELDELEWFDGVAFHCDCQRKP